MIMKHYKSDALAAVHETALGLAEAGVMPKRTIKVFDDLCLTPHRRVVTANESAQFEFAKMRARLYSPDT